MTMKFNVRAATQRTFGAIALTGALLVGCSNPDAADTTDATDSVTAESDPAEAVTEGGTGTLAVRANGEDFVRQGFTTKDGWTVNFDNLYVHLSDVTAYQTDPPYDAMAGGEPDAKETVVLVESQTVDLAEGGDDAEPILLQTTEAPSGQYNAISWKMTPAAEGPAEGYVMMLDGTAEKDGETVDFLLKFDQPLTFTCGEFVGDQRKGILQPDDSAELETTFHFDHLFGDGEAPPDDAINTGALGFDPIADLAEDGTVDVELATLMESLSPEQQETLTNVLPSLGHVGEGHCDESVIGSSKGEEMEEEAMDSES